MKYPDEWKGGVPEGIHQVKAGHGMMTVPAFFSLAWIQHFGQPVWKSFDKMMVWDVACGTGESSLVSALAHNGARYVLSEDDEESLNEAKAYKTSIGLENVIFADNDPTAALEKKADIVFCTRPLNHMDRVGERLVEWAGHLAPGGILEVRCETDPTATGVSARRHQLVGKLKAAPGEEARVLQEALTEGLAQTDWTAPNLIQMVEGAGLDVFTLVHPQMYDPLLFFNDPGEAMRQFTAECTLTERAGLAELLAGGMTAHTLLAVPRGDSRKMPLLSDPDARTLIPFRSPYAEVRREANEVIFHVERWGLPINELVPLGEVAAPASMEAVFAAIDGKKTFEQLHRRFLPMTWDVFWHFMTVLGENGLIHPHREETKDANA